MPRLPPMLSFVAPSGTGKTTLLEGVIRHLASQGVRVGVLKHDAHRLKLDKPGKDTWRFRQAGAWRAIIASADQFGCFSDIEGELSLGGIVDPFLVDADIVITEGFRRSGLPCIRVYRDARGHDPTWHVPTNVIAWASDAPLEVQVPVLDLNDPVAVADFVRHRFLGEHPDRVVTGVVPLAHPLAGAELERYLAPLRAVCGERVLVVHGPKVVVPPHVLAVPDLRPGLGPLGALLTALAYVDTPDVLFVGTTGAQPSAGLLHGLMHWGPQHADVVVPIRGGLPEPTMGLYGHRCLAAIKASLLSGEARMKGWWGHVRVHRVEESVWRVADPEGKSFPQR